MNDYGIPKAWGSRTVWNSEGKGGLSILEFPKARGGLDEDAARGRVWIFSGITQSRFPGISQIPNPVKIFCVFLNPAPYFGKIPDHENTLPDPVGGGVGYLGTIQYC